MNPVFSAKHKPRQSWMIAGVLHRNFPGNRLFKRSQREIGPGTAQTLNRSTCGLTESPRNNHRTNYDDFCDVYLFGIQVDNRLTKETCL